MNRSLLITNDDGIYAEGIQLLGQALFDCDAGYDLAIVAPNHEQSAVGHAITMHRPLRVHKARFLHNPDLVGWSVNGTPSDCVKLAVEAILPQKPDLVISGINRGGNLGTDVIYSGTVSAAVEGIILGIPAVAVSLMEGGTEKDFKYAAAFVRDLVPRLLENSLPQGTILNINVPSDSEKIKGIRITHLGKRQYMNSFDRRLDPRGEVYYWLAGELVEGDEPEDSDVQAMLDGYISITPVHFDLTNYDYLPELEKLLHDLLHK